MSLVFVTVSFSSCFLSFYFSIFFVFNVQFSEEKIFRRKPQKSSQGVSYAVERLPVQRECTAAFLSMQAVRILRVCSESSDLGVRVIMYVSALKFKRQGLQCIDADRSETWRIAGKIFSISWIYTIWRFVYSSKLKV